MDDIFNASRLKLIDLFASVQKEEAVMEPLVSADPPDDNKVLSQIDRVAQARAELEKARARMSLDIRRQLTHDQWVGVTGHAAAYAWATAPWRAAIGGREPEITAKFAITYIRFLFAIEIGYPVP